MVICISFTFSSRLFRKSPFHRRLSYKLKDSSPWLYFDEWEVPTTKNERSREVVTVEMN